jgi:hypothetical protein
MLTFLFLTYFHVLSLNLIIYDIFLSVSASVFLSRKTLSVSHQIQDDGKWGNIKTLFLWLKQKCIRNGISGEKLNLRSKGNWLEKYETHNIVA